MLSLFILFVHAFPFTSVDNHQEESLSEKISAAAVRQGKPLHFSYTSQLMSCNCKSSPCCCPVLHFSHPNSCSFRQMLRAVYLMLSLFWYKPPPTTNDPVGTTSSFSAMWQYRQKSSCPPWTLTAHTSTISKEVLKHKIFRLTHYWGQKENTLRLALTCRTNSC